MEISQEDNATLKRFLIGALPEDEAGAVGERMLTDDEFLDRAAALETELVEDYLDGNLSADDRRRFEDHFLRPPSHRKKLHIAQALRSYANESVPARGAGAREPEALGSSAELEAAATPESGGTGATDSKAVPLQQEAVSAPRSEPLYPVSPVFSIKPSRRFVFAAPRVRPAIAAVVILAGLAGLAFYRLVVYRSDLDKGAEILSNLYKNERPIEARVASLSWAPVENSRGEATNQRGHNNDSGKTDLQGENDDQIQRAKVVLQRALKERPGPAAEHEYGVFLLTSEKSPEAVEHLRTAASGDPKSATYRSDFGAALLEAGKHDRGTETEKASHEFNESMDELTAALKIDPDFKPALFNLALYFEAQQDWSQAEGAWTKYLAVDPNSAWASEAREHLKQVKQRISDSTNHGY
jgi:tetratricopeptide (TPR) repeat protein